MKSLVQFEYLLSNELIHPRTLFLHSPPISRNNVLLALLEINRALQIVVNKAIRNIVRVHPQIQPTKMINILSYELFLLSLWRTMPLIKIARILTLVFLIIKLTVEVKHPTLSSQVLVHPIERTKERVSE